MKGFNRSLIKQNKFLKIKHFDTQSWWLKSSIKPTVEFANKCNIVFKKKNFIKFV